MRRTVTVGGLAAGIALVASACYPGTGTYSVSTSGAKGTIKPGTYVSDGHPGICIWERRRTTGTAPSGTITGELTGDRAVVTVKSTDKVFRTQGCGTWTALTRQARLLTSFGDGDWITGTDIAARTYQSTIADELGYWERAVGATHEERDVVAFDVNVQGARAVVTVAGSQRLSSHGFRTWTPLVRRSPPLTRFGAGDWIAGTDIASGTYRATVTDRDGGFWEVATGTMHTEAEVVGGGDVGYGQRATVTITAGRRISSGGFGTWTKVG